MFGGSMVAIVTPFRKGEVDWEKLKELVEFHIENGTCALVPCGTTGESPTLSHKEHDGVVEAVVEAAGGRIPVVAGAGSNSTREALRLAKHAKEAGADGVLVIVPYYNKPTQEGMVRHFETVASQVDIPVVLYNIPGRTGVNMLPETVARLSKVDNIVAVKEASGSIDQVSRILSLCDITVLSGDDSLTFPMLALGGKGVVSVAANIVPRDVSNMCKFFEEGDLHAAREMHFRLLDLCKVLFVETNPAPIKAAMGMLGICGDEVRLPLVPLLPENREKVKTALEAYGLLQKE